MEADSNTNQGENDGSGRPPLPTKTPSKPREAQLKTDNPIGFSPPGMRLRSGTKKPPTPLKFSSATATTRKKRRRSEEGSEDEGSKGSDTRSVETTERSFVKRSRASVFEPVADKSQQKEEIDREEGQEPRVSSSVSVDRDGDAAMQGTGPDSPSRVQVIASVPEKERSLVENESSPSHRTTTSMDVEDTHETLKVNHIDHVEKSSSSRDPTVINQEKSVHVATDASLVVPTCPPPEIPGQDTMVVDVPTQPMESTQDSGLPLPQGREVHVDSLVISSPFVAKENETTTETVDMTIQQPMISRHEEAAQQPFSPPVIRPTVTLDGLRLPSQHTPAPRKLDVTYTGRNKMKDFITPAKIIVTHQAENDLFRREKDSSDANGTDSEMEVLQLKMIQGAEVQEEEEERSDGRRDGLYHYMSHKERRQQTVKTAMMLSILLSLHAVLAFLMGHDFMSFAPFWVWNDLSIAANRTLQFYRDHKLVAPAVEPIQPEPVIVEELITKTVFVDNETLAEEEMEKMRERKKIEWWKSEKDDINKVSQETEDAANEYLLKVELLQKIFSEDQDEYKSRESSMLVWKSALSQAKKKLSENSSENPEDVHAILGQLVEVSGIPLSSEDLDLSELSVLPIPGEKCSGRDFLMTPVDDQAEYMTTEDMAQARVELDSFLSATLSDIKNDQELFWPISQWIDQQFREHVAAFNLGALPDVDRIQLSVKKQADTRQDDDMDASEVQEIIDREVEILKADGTGKHDFASLRSGAKVISTGPLGTSPSLVQNLPLGNQLMSKLGLRFYGHGPDAALEPTFPRDALGQCWSFEKEGVRKRITIKELDNREIQSNPNRGMYATLAVNLSKPIFVTEILLEHAPVSVSSNRDTAIKDFRVIGFDDEGANGNPWLLLASEYDSQHDAVQYYEVERELEDGTPIPKIASVVLAIDSNWGADYSCLYRFRVHGLDE